jgi:2-hydroxycyclohexanecarboxyl-CoA dehydrogenase
VNLAGKIVVVTGAARGIGATAARRMAALGAELFVVDIAADAVNETAQSIRTQGGRAHGRVCDLGDDEMVERLAPLLPGKIDILLNNAAAQQFGAGGIAQLDLSNWRRSLEINLLGQVRMVHALLPALRRSGSGYIVNTASSLVIRPNAVARHLMPYVTSKGAILSFTQALAFAMHDEGIDVSLFCPGLTTTREDGSTKPNSMGWMSGVPKELTIPRTMDEAVDDLLEGMAARRFLISSDLGYTPAIVRLAEHGLDPRSDYQ